MFIYLGVIFLSTLLLLVSDNERSRRIVCNRRAAFNTSLIVFIALLLPCILAGLRDIGVGTDTRGYAKWVFELANDSSNVSAFLKAALDGKWRMEPLYALEAFIATRFMKQHTFLFFFFIQASIDIPIYLGIRTFAKKKSTWLAMLVYYLFIYPLTLNLMRQLIAAAFLFYGTSKLVMERKVVFWWAMLAIAFGFHRSALVGITIVLAWYSFKYLLYKRLSFKKTLFITLIMCVCFFVAGDLIIRFVVSHNDTYTSYLSSRNAHGTSTFVAPFVIYGSAILLVATSLLECYKTRDFTAQFTTLLAAMSIPTRLFGFVSAPFGRITWFFFVFILAMTAIAYKDRFKLSELDFFQILLIFLGVAQFGWFYVINGGAEIVPYTSVVLGIT